MTYHCHFLPAVLKNPEPILFRMFQRKYLLCLCHIRCSPVQHRGNYNGVRNLDRYMDA